MTHIHTIEELRSWWRNLPRSRGFRSVPAFSSLTRYYVREHGELSLLRSDDSVIVYARVPNGCGFAQRTHKPGSDVARRLWALKHKEAS